MLFNNVYKWMVHLLIRWNSILIIFLIRTIQFCMKHICLKCIYSFCSFRRVEIHEETNSNTLKEYLSLNIS